MSPHDGESWFLLDLVELSDLLLNLFKSALVQLMIIWLLTLCLLDFDRQVVLVRRGVLKRLSLLWNLLQMRVQRPLTIVLSRYQSLIVRLLLSRKFWWLLTWMLVLIFSKLGVLVTSNLENWLLECYSLWFLISVDPEDLLYLAEGVFQLFVGLRPRVGAVLRAENWDWRLWFDVTQHRCIGGFLWVVVLDRRVNNDLPLQAVDRHFPLVWEFRVGGGAWLHGQAAAHHWGWLLRASFSLWLLRLTT